MPRPKDSINEFRELHEQEIMSAFRNIFGEFGGMSSAKQIYAMVAKAPASRFFVAPKRAAEIVSQMLRGDMLALPRSTNQRMYFEIYFRVRQILEKHPEMAILDAVKEVVQAPAPEMYKSPRQIQEIIKNHKFKCSNTRK